MTVKDPGKQTYPMNPDAKAKWLEALRSGKYPQSTGALARTGGRGFCCLGVLCETQKVSRSPMEDGEYMYHFEFGTDYYDSIPYQWQSISPGATSYLIHMNDYLGKSFDDIADWIDANL